MGAGEPFVARYSPLRLAARGFVAWVMTALSIGVLSGTFGRPSVFVLAAAVFGIVFFGGIGAVHLARMFDRRPQVIIDAQGLYVRSHGETRIGLRSIERIVSHKDRLAIYLYKPSKYPIETRHRRLIYRVNGGTSRGFFGDVWIWANVLDQPVGALAGAIAAHRPQTEFEKSLATRL